MTLSYVNATNLETFDEASSNLRGNACPDAHLLVAVTESVLSAYTRGSASTMGRLRRHHPACYVEHEDDGDVYM